MIRIRRALFEIEIQIPLSCFVILGMNEQRPDAGNLGSLCCAQKRVFEKCFTEPLLLFGRYNCEPREDHDRNRMVCETFSNAIRNRCVFDRADAEAVISYDLIGSATDDIGLRATGLLVRQGKAFEKLVEWKLSTLKRFKQMMRRKLFDRSEWIACHSSTLFSVSKRAKRGLNATG